MRVPFLVCLTVLTLGCLCGIPGLEDGGVVCNRPYIRVGGECCLDENQNSICDVDESSTTVVVESSSTTSMVVETTSSSSSISSSTSSASSTSTVEATTSVSHVYGCVEDAGYDPGKFIYVYSDGCGSQFVSQAEAAASQKDMGVIKLNIYDLIQNDKKIGLMECFLGEFTQSTQYNFRLCPRLMCPATGEIENVDGSRPVSIQMRSFAGRCG